jgi:hypothetical protein
LIYRGLSSFWEHSRTSTTYVSVSQWEVNSKALPRSVLAIL